MKRLSLLVTFLFLFTLQPVFAAATTSTPPVSDPLERITNNSEILNQVEETRNNNSGGFDEFMKKLRDLSIPIAITVIVIAGLLLLVGFVVPAFRKVAGGMILGGIVGLVLINFGEYITGGLFAAVDFLKTYLS